MADDRPTTAEPAEEEQTPVPPAPARRSALPWILLGIGAVVLAGIGILVAVVVIPAFVGAPKDPVDTVEAFDRAYRDVDCALFQESTTEAFRAVSQGADDAGEFSCAAWEAEAARYTVDGEYQYEIDVVDTAVADDEATVLTHETEVDTGEEYDYRYTLVPDVDGGWVVDALVETEEE